MIRVATTVVGPGGGRAIGTYIPAVHADGTPNPVITTVLNRQPYVGLAQMVGSPYITAYEPIVDARGRVFSILFVGERLRNVEAIRQSIMQITIGRSGNVVVLGAKGNQRGRYIISSQGRRDGEDLNDSVDSQGNYFVRSMVQASQRSRPLFSRSIEFPRRI